MIIRLVTTGNDENTRIAQEQLGRLPNTTVEVSYCPQTVAEWFECPFVRVDSGHEYFGLAGIEFFVEQRLGGSLVQ
jgi:hypothetical protein